MVVEWMDRNIQWVELVELSVDHTVHRRNRKMEEEQVDSLVVEYRGLLLDLRTMHKLQLLQHAVAVVVAAAAAELVVVVVELVVELAVVAVVVEVAAEVAVAELDRGKIQERVGRMDRKVVGMIEEEQSVVE